MALTKEELFKPRYKLIADYPGCPWYIGRIITKISEYNWDCIEEPTSSGLRMPENYPANFQLLPWYSDRRPEDIPQFVITENGIVDKIKEVKIDSDGLLYYTTEEDSLGWYFYQNGLMPGTIDDYNEYIANLNK